MDFLWKDSMEKVFKGVEMEWKVMVRSSAEVLKNKGWKAVRIVALFLGLRVV